MSTDRLLANNGNDSTRCNASQAARAGSARIRAGERTDIRLQQWIASQISRSLDWSPIVEALLRCGADIDQAKAWIREIASSPAFAELCSVQGRHRALEQMVSLSRERRMALTGDGLKRITDLDPDDFLERFWVPGTPVVIGNLVQELDAFTKWCVDYFVANFGSVEVEVLADRCSRQNPDQDWRELRRRMTFHTFLELCFERPPNDVYMVRKNDAFCRPGMEPLLTDLNFRHGPFSELRPEHTGLWIGGPGTHVRLHYDNANSVLCQISGRKRVRLAAAESLALLDLSNSAYCTWDPPDDLEGEDAPETVTELILEPGDALFIPAGVWHQVTSLDFSVSVSVIDFQWPNSCSWYQPGEAVAGRKPAQPFAWQANPR